MIDFSPNRPDYWPALSEKTFEVYRVGDTDADIREGQDFPKLQATWHYDWSTPTADGGSSVHGIWDQTSKNVKGLLGVATMRLIGRRFLASYYQRVYDGLVG
jgi:hypothetical protein